MAPILTDRHGVVLSQGNKVIDIEDESTFVVSTVVQWGTSPVVFILDDGKGGFVDASIVMLSEDEKCSRATLCEVCDNHYESGVTWFKSKYNHPNTKHSVYSACDVCLFNIDDSTLPRSGNLMGRLTLSVCRINCRVARL